MITSIRIHRPSFLRGMARVLDLGGMLGRRPFPLHRDPVLADTRALMLDWQAVAGDIALAFDQTTRHVREVQNAREGAYQG